MCVRTDGSQHMPSLNPYAVLLHTAVVNALSLLAAPANTSRRGRGGHPPGVRHCVPLMSDPWPGDQLRYSLHDVNTHADQRTRCCDSAKIRCDKGILPVITIIGIAISTAAGHQTHRRALPSRSPLHSCRFTQEIQLVNGYRVKYCLTGSASVLRRRNVAVVAGVFGRHGRRMSAL
jgi:hypothetical protein